MSNDTIFKEETPFSANPQETFETPFLNTPMYAPEQFSPEERQNSGASWLEMETPFLKEFDTFEGGVSTESMEFNQFINEMYDHSFNETLHELAAEAFETYGDRLTADYLDQETQNSESTRLLMEFFQPLERECEAMLDKFKQDFGRYDIATITESELEMMLDRYEPSTANLSPAFEEFLGKLLKKVKGVVKGAVNLARKGIGTITKLGLGPILEKLKGFIRPLLQQVLKYALNKLPENLRPLASRLAGKLFQKVGLSGEVSEQEYETDIPALPNAETIQSEFDLAVGELLFSSLEAEQETVTAQYADEAGQNYENPAAAAQEARAQLVDGLNRLEKGQDPTPLLEQFVPAIMAIKPIAKIALRIIGRQKVVNFIAGYMAKFIQKFIGPEYASMLSRAIVDSGLRLLGLEIPPNSERNLASEAVASTLEQALTEIAGVPEYVLENEELLEVALSEALENAASANFPPSMLKPEFHEVADGGGTWVLMPLKNKRKYYKKYTRIRDVTIPPQIAHSVTTFGGKTLAGFFNDQLGISPGRCVTARAHLYEAIPGTWLSRISLFEKGTPGLGSAANTAFSLIHPLTPAAAAVLFGSGKLGRKVEDRFLSGRDMIAVGQRFYYLEITGSHPAFGAPKTPGGGPFHPHFGTPKIPGGRGGGNRKSSEINLVFDIPRTEIRAAIFLSETVSQEISTKLRQKSLASAIKLLKGVYEAGLASIFSKQFTQYLKIITDEPQKEQFLGGVGNRIKMFLSLMGKKLERLLKEWISTQISQYLKQRDLEFINATTSPLDGVTILITFTNVPVMGAIRKILKGEFKDIQISSGKPGAVVKIVPGFRNA